MFDPVSMLAAHQRALMVKKHVRRLGNRGGFGSSFGRGSNSGVGASVANLSKGSRNMTLTNPPKRATGSNTIKCPTYGEVGYKQSNCRKVRKKACLLIHIMVGMRM